MSRHLRRVQYLERRFLGGPAVAAIIRPIEAADNDELRRLNESGELEAMARRLSENELARLVRECERLLRLEQLKKDENIETTRLGFDVGVEPQGDGCGFRRSRLADPR